MNPVVIIKVNGIEWRSEVCVSGGRNPRWEFQHMDLEVANMEHEMYIEVRDRDPFTSQMIGHVRTKVGFFAVPGGRAEWLELFFEGYPAGRIHFRSDFTPQIAQQIVGMPTQTVIAPQVIVEKPVVVNPVVGRMGLLKLHLIEAHLTHNTNPGLFERMDPFVIIKVNMQEWRSAVCMGGGKNPRWEFQFMEHQVFDLNHEVYIEVRDRDPMITEMIGSARVPLRFFCVPAGLIEWIELFFMGMPAGRIQFRSEYFPEIVVAGGMGNTTVIVEPAPMIMGGSMGGGGGGMMKGALMGAMVATDIALMERNAHHNNHHNTRVVVVNTHGHRR